MPEKSEKIQPRLPRGFVDTPAQNFRLIENILHKIRAVYELYGFEPLELPLLEYTEVLGKFLPDEERPNAGVFSLQDDDEQWLSLRYDLTAPLARHVAQHYETLVKPYRSYRFGPVFRNEKAGPGRFRQFLQCDADIVGASSVRADAEICMMGADIIEKIGLHRGDYRVRVNNRKVLDGVLDLIGLDTPSAAGKRLQVLRAIDKLDKFGVPGVALLLGKGRLDESGDFTAGAGLDADAIEKVLAFVQAGTADSAQTLARLRTLVASSPGGLEGVEELEEMHLLIEAAGYADRILIDPSVVRGLEYYTGPVFEIELLFDVTNKQGQKVVFGSVGGGGRYDGLVSLFRQETAPATGLSIGVSRLVSALKDLPYFVLEKPKGPVVILVMDKEREALQRYQRMASSLRAAGIRAEVYAGSASMKAQMKYADRCGAPCVVIQGSREREQGLVQVKDLVEGARLAQSISDNQIWRETRPAQATLKEEDLVAHIRQLLS